MNRSAREQAVDVLHRQIADLLGEELIAEFPCNRCPMVHSADLVSGAVRVELAADIDGAVGDLLLLDHRAEPVTSVRVALSDVHRGGAGLSAVGPDVRVVEFDLTAKRRGRGNRRRRASLDSGLSVTTRLQELSAGRLYVDRHNLSCPRPLCISCRQTLPLRTISIREVNCWHCGKPTKIALGTIDIKILYPDDFTRDERVFAMEHGGVKLVVQSSSAFGDRYLANVCGHCGSVQGDWTLEVNVHERTLASASDQRSEFGPCARCTIRSCDWHGANPEPP